MGSQRDYIRNPYELREQRVDGENGERSIFYIEGPSCYLGPFDDEDLAESVACALFTALCSE